MSLSLTLIPLAIGASSAIAFALKDKVEEGEFYRVDTNMKDETILQEALKSHGCSVTVDEERFQSTIGDIQLAFQEQDNGTFSAVFSNAVESADAEDFMRGIQNEYTRLVQKQTYEKLLERAKAEGLVLEAENKNEDGTIVMTFQVKENLNHG